MFGIANGYPTVEQMLPVVAEPVLTDEGVAFYGSFDGYRRAKQQFYDYPVVEEALPVVIEEPAVIENGAIYSDDDVFSLDAYDYTKK